MKNPRTPKRHTRIFHVERNTTGEELSARVARDRTHRRIVLAGVPRFIAGLAVERVDRERRQLYLSGDVPDVELKGLRVSFAGSSTHHNAFQPYRLAWPVRREGSLIVALQAFTARPPAVGERAWLESLPSVHGNFAAKRPKDLVLVGLMFTSGRVG